MLRIVQNLTFTSLLVAGVVATGNDTPVSVITHQLDAARWLSTAAETSQWIQIGSDIDGENKRDFAGGTQGALAMDELGTTLVVGASGYNNTQGHTRVFDLADGVWTQRGEDIKGEFGKIHPRFGGDNSGASVVVSADGNVVGIGEPNSDAGKTGKFEKDYGQVRVFEWTEGAWSQRGTAITGAATFDFASEAGGLAMDSSGSTIVVGSREHNGAQGHVRVFKWTADDWVQRGGDIDGEGAGDFFGGAVAISANGNTVAAGALFNEVSKDQDNERFACKVCKGSVRIFDWQQANDDLTASWVQRWSDIDGEEEHDYSGSSVALSENGNVVAVGAPSNTGENKKGSVTVYESDDASKSWKKRGEPIKGEENGDLSGSALALSSSGNTVAIGARLNSNSKGHARIFQWTGDGGWVQRGDDIDGENKFDESGYSLAMNAEGNMLASGARYTADAGYFAGHARVFQWIQAQVTPTKEPTMPPTKKTTMPPTKKPTTPPTKKPTMSPTKKSNQTDCEDDKYFQKGRSKRNCEAYLKKNGVNKCSRKYNTKKVFDFCVKTCGGYGLGKCVI